MITNKNEAKKHISCDCKCKCNSTRCNSNQKWNNETCQSECKNYHKCNKDYSLNPSKCVWEKSKYLKTIVENSKFVCKRIIFFQI